MAPTEPGRTHRGRRKNWATGLQKFAVVVGLLGVLPALTSSQRTPGDPRLRLAASALQTGSSAAKGRPWFPIGNTGDDGSWFNNPVGRMAYVFRAALDMEKATNNKYKLGVNWNVALGFVNITGLKNLDTRGFRVADAHVLKTSDPALYNELDLANHPNVQRFAIIPAINEAKPQEKITDIRETLHAEQMIILQGLSFLSPSNGGAVFTPDRFFEVYTDNSPCSGLPNRPIDCADVMPWYTRVLFGAQHKSPNYSQLRKTQLDTAYVLAQKDPAFAGEVETQVSLIRAYIAAKPNRLAKIKVLQSRVKAAGDRLFRTYPAAASAPCTGQNFVNQAEPCASANASPDSAASSNASGFDQLLAEPNVASPGGIDFSRIQLDYLSDPGDGSGLQYAFAAPASLSDGGSTSDALGTADLASVAFFVWLELDSSADWVNLNPTEPDRVVDAQMGQTDVGRIMLQADLQLKKDVGMIIHPDTPVGSQFWSEIDGDCLSSRVWVVPTPAQVYSTGDRLYILKAPLNVKMESDYIQIPQGQSAAANCPKQDATTQEHNEALFRSLVLPKLVDMVNTDPSFADLRTVYRSRVAAQWYRNLSASQHTTYEDLIGQGDITSWTTKTGWTPENTFQQYVTSYTEGDYHITHAVTKGNYIYKHTYTYGGVDFTNVPLEEVSSAVFAADNADMAQNVAQSLGAPTLGDSGMVMFGSPTPLQAARAAQTAVKHPSGSDPLLSSTIERRIPLLFVLAALVVWQRRRDALESRAK